MKKIAFIDLHPRNPICRTHLASGAFDAFGTDASAIYLFKSSGRDYACEGTLPIDSAGDLGGIDAVYLSIPAVLLDFRILHLPFSDREKISRILPLELDNLVMGGSREIVFDRLVLGGDETSWDVLVVYIRREILSLILADLSKRNMDPRSISSLDLGLALHAGQDLKQVLSAEGLTESLLHPEDWQEKRRIEAARKELSEPGINLRTGPFAYRRDAEKAGKIFKTAIVLALLLVLVVHGNLLFQTIMVRKEASVLTENMHTAYRRLFPGEKKTVDPLYQLKSHLREIIVTEKELSGVETLQFLLNLSKSRVENVIFTEISIERGLIKLKAEAPSLGDLDKTKRKLMELLPNVSISDVRPTTPGKIHFTVIAKDSAS